MRVGLLWQAEWDPFEPGVSLVGETKLHGMFDAFASLGVDADPVVSRTKTSTSSGRSCAG